MSQFKHKFIPFTYILNKPNNFQLMAGAANSAWNLSEVAVPIALPIPASGRRFLCHPTGELSLISPQTQNPLPFKSICVGLLDTRHGGPVTCRLSQTAQQLLALVGAQESLAKAVRQKQTQTQHPTHRFIKPSVQQI